MAERGSDPFIRLAVIGAGTTGAGIAQQIAAAGLPVDLADLDRDKIARGIERIRASLAEGTNCGVFTEEKARTVLARIRGVEDWGELSDAGLVIEAIFENLDIKREVFRKLERLCGPRTILATNTSSFRVRQIAEAVADQSRVIGLHHFFLLAKSRLVEVVPTAVTSTAVREVVWAVQQRIGNSSILSTDSPGFVIHRFFFPWLIEGIRLLQEEQIDIPTIEAAAKQAFGVGMGPFEMMNSTGIPIALHVSRTLGQALGPFYAPPERFFQQSETKRPWPLDGAPNSKHFEAIEQRLMGAVLLAAGQLADERVGSIEDTDIGARIGLGWPRGPFQLANEIGVGRAADLVRPLAERWGLDLPETLSSRAANGQPFRFCRVRSSVRDRVATLTIHRPDSLNALNEQVVDQLADTFHMAASDPDVDGIVIAGSGRSFVVGADIGFFLRQIERRDLERIVEFTKTAHVLLNAIEHCPKPVIARVHGLALGGGLEIALACHRIVATPEARLGFPETGLGIFPGLGGTQRTTRRIGVGMTKALIFTGDTITADDAVAIGLVDTVVSHGKLGRTIRAMIAHGLPPNDTPALVGDAATLAKFFAHNSVEDLRTGRVDTHGSPVLVRAVEQVSGKAPLALRVAERLIDDGLERPLHEGLHMELEHLTEIFGSRDAYEGLRSLGTRTARFEGH